MRVLSSAGLITFTLILLGVAYADSSYPVGGSQPDQRPAGAPVIEQADHEGPWYKHALTGLKAPHPQSFSFLDYQGNWHTPFDRPGMTGPYDIRGWHQNN